MILCGGGMAMATAASKHEVDELRELLTELSRQSLRSELSISRLSQEMRDFKDEMAAFKDETVRDRQRMNKQWGDLANRLGTLVEDIVAPNLPRVAAELLGCTEPSLFALRVVRHWQGETREYDALVVCEDAVLINETKSKLQAAHVDAFIAKLAELPLVFPEYAGRRLVGVLASLAVDKGVVAVATRHGVAIMAMGEDTMQVLNPEAVRPAG
jgi:hypothetical protein